MKPFYDSDGVTIYHADCADIEAPADADLLLTDPPYGIALDTDYRRFKDGSRHRTVENDAEPFDPKRLLSFPCRKVIWGANHFYGKLPTGGTWIVWDKILTNDITRPFAAGEMAWSTAGGKNVEIFRHMWNGAYRDSERNLFSHPTQKPVALMRWVLERWTEPGDLIFDPYMGSGPIAQACYETGRRYIGVEIVEEYCETAVKRLAQQVLSF